MSDAEEENTSKRFQGTENIVLEPEVAKAILKSNREIRSTIEYREFDAIEQYTPAIGKAVADIVFCKNYQRGRGIFEYYFDYPDIIKQFHDFLNILSKQPKALEAYVNSKNDLGEDLIQRIAKLHYGRQHIVFEVCLILRELPDQGLKTLFTKTKDKKHNNLEILNACSSNYFNNSLVFFQCISDTANRHKNPEQYMDALIKGGLNNLSVDEREGDDDYPLLFKTNLKILTLKYSDDYKTLYEDKKLFNRFFSNSNELRDTFNHQRNHIIGGLFLLDKNIRKIGESMSPFELNSIFREFDAELFGVLYKDLKPYQAEMLASEFHKKLSDFNGKVNTVSPKGEWPALIEKKIIEVPSEIAENRYFENVTSSKKLRRVADELAICISDSDKVTEFLNHYFHVMVLCDKKTKAPLATMRFSVHPKDLNYEGWHIKTPNCILMIHDITNYANRRDFSIDDNAAIEWIKKELESGKINILETALEHPQFLEDGNIALYGKIGIKNIIQRDALGGVDVWQRAFDYYGKPAGVYDMRPMKKYIPYDLDPTSTTPLSKMDITKTPRIKGIPAIKIQLADGTNRYMLHDEDRGINVREFIIKYDFDKKFMDALKAIFPQKQKQLEQINLRKILQTQLGKKSQER